jgi:GntR family transcriptional repressor for pyruvate dehydrogenase complex
MATLINKELLNTKIVREIIALISTGEFSEGSRLPSERKLCERFGVSRGTIRQALADLESLGVIETRLGSGSYVIELSVKKLPDNILPRDFNNVNLEDIVVARKAIETVAIELACEKATKKDYEDLEKLIDWMVESLNSLPAFIRYDMAFHQQIVKASDNAALVTAFNAITEYHKYSQVFTSLHEGEEEVAIDYHRRMLYALHKKNKELAHKAITEHLDEMLLSLGAEK